MARTGKRAAALLDALTRTGLEPLAKSAAPPRPALSDLSTAGAAEVLRLYRALGGTQAMPAFRPGVWDLCFRGPLLVELDEELHFNRYRAATLATSWAAQLPWTAEYRNHCAQHEPACLGAGAWGKRWANESAARMFSGGLAGDLQGDGAPRWKQRALYDGLKDLLPLVGGDARLARVATHDDVNGAPLGVMLDGLMPVDAEGIRALVDSRSA